MKCENCGEEIKGGMFGKNKLLDEDFVKLINSELNLEAKSYCNNCGDKLVDEATTLRNKRNSKIENIKENLEGKVYNYNIYLEKNIKHIPILTTHSPYNWEYTSLELVSGQLVTGTGIISELFSDFTDFFGAKSGSFTNKLTKNEDKVLNILRAKTMQLEGNAVIATDIDYAEVGGAKGMLMVCAAGTAVRLHNMNVLNEESKIILEKIETWFQNKKIIEKLLSLEEDDFLEEYNKYKF